MTSVLFICMGNICRSPTAHAVMQDKVNAQGLSKRIRIDSAGTHAYHVNEKSDPRSRLFAKSQGIDMEYIRARKVSVNDYDEFDYVLAMDDSNLELLQHFAPENYSAKVALFLSFANNKGVNETVVPDPYYGGDQGFVNVFKLVDQGCDALIEHILHG